MFWDKTNRQERMTYSELDSYTWSTNLGANVMTDTQFKESTYFKVIKRLSEDIAKMPMQLKQHTDNGDRLATEHPLYQLFNTRPNPYMSSFDFWKGMEATRQHKGDSWAGILRDPKNALPIGLFPITVTKIVIDNAGLFKSKMQNPILIFYTCSSNLQEYTCFYSEVVHLKGFTLDGFNSISVKDNLQETIDTTKAAQSYQKDLFSNGLTNKAAVQMTSDITDPNELKKVQNKFNKMYSSKGRIFTIPAGFEITPLNLNLADSQFSELKKMGAVDICTAFGVPPHLIGIMDGYNNNSLEQSNLNYLVNTLLILMETIEAELNYKLLSIEDIMNGYYFTFNEKIMLRTDAKTQAEILTKYVQSSIYAPNEARQELGRMSKPDGDDLIASSGTLKLKDLYLTAKNNANNLDKNNSNSSGGGG